MGKSILSPFYDPFNKNQQIPLDLKKGAMEGHKRGINPSPVLAQRKMFGKHEGFGKKSYSPKTAAHPIIHFFSSSKFYVDPKFRNAQKLPWAQNRKGHF